MRGDIVTASSGERVVLADIGLVELYDGPRVRVWDVSLEPGECHPWHQHHNPYVVLSLTTSAGRMDWLDGSDPRFVSEYRGGALYRPVSPVHRLTNVGRSFYRNRLIELKDLGEHLPAPLDIGPGAGSVQDDAPGGALADGRMPVLLHEDVSVWTVTVPAGVAHTVDLGELPHVVAAIEPDTLDADSAGGVRWHASGPCTLTNIAISERTWFLVELGYLARSGSSG